ncbi:unnamed protein product [Cuscuta europaea]|uniref:RNase H type-1 domain-containing protein n=1 Tax=Cuscuta europaea TaxID=41803 RepID=A0A9P0ZQQ2_CUSEU|nr:unnamed protein product [Cuscuta europaea]
MGFRERGVESNDCTIFLEERIIQRIEEWNARLLPKAGHEVLLKTVIQALTQYATNGFFFPKELCGEAIWEAWRETKTVAFECAAPKKKQRWKAPGTGCVELNVDAAVEVSVLNRGFRMVVRDENASCVAVRSQPWRRSFLARDAEALAITEALLWARQHGWLNIVIESDAKQVVHDISFYHHIRSN